jgi:hypothetical protein
MKFEDKLKVSIALISLILIITLAFYFTVYMYKDCKKVGHTTLYCLLNLK